MRETLRRLKLIGREIPWPLKARARTHAHCGILISVYCISNMQYTLISISQFHAQLCPARCFSYSHRLSPPKKSLSQPAKISRVSREANNCYLAFNRCIETRSSASSTRAPTRYDSRARSSRTSSLADSLSSRYDFKKALWRLYSGSIQALFMLHQMRYRLPPTSPCTPPAIASLPSSLESTCSSTSSA